MVEPSAWEVTVDDMVASALAAWREQAASAAKKKPSIDPTYPSATKSATELRLTLQTNTNLRDSVNAGQKMSHSTVFFSGPAVGVHLLHYWDIHHDRQLLHNFTQISEALDAPCDRLAPTGWGQSQVEAFIVSKLGLDYAEGPSGLKRNRTGKQRGGTVFSDPSFRQDPTLLEIF